MDFLKEFSKQFSSMARSASEKSKDGAEVNRLGAELKAAEASLDSLYGRFGRACYALRSGGGNPDAVEELAMRIRSETARMEELAQAVNAARELKRCPGCGAIFPKEARFCSACGKKLPEEAPKPEPMNPGEYCPACGAERVSGEPVCQVCGTRFDPLTSPEAPESIPTIKDPALEEPDGEME